MDESGYQRYQKFFHADCERIVEWQDTETEARGWLAINSLTGGASGGGTRMKAGASREDAIFLAKTMEIKFRVCGPAIGGAKSVLSFAPRNEEEKHGVLRRWFQHIGPLLQECYGTGGDQGVSEDEVIGLTRAAIGLGHPQEGVVRGHFHHPEETHRRIIRQLDEGVELPVHVAGLGRELPLADLITGFGVASALKAYHELTGRPLAGRRVIIEGFGAVGGPSAYYLQEMGARVVGVICQLPGAARMFRWYADPAGIDAWDLMKRREGPHRTDLPAGGVESASNDAFWETEADIFVPAATSYTITPQRIAQLRKAGVEVIGCGANTPFADLSHGDVAVQREADAAFTVIPDFVANCGMARTFAYLMQDGVEVSEAAIQADVDRTIHRAMERLLEGWQGGPGLLNRAFSLFVPCAGDSR